MSADMRRAAARIALFLMLSGTAPAGAAPAMWVVRDADTLRVTISELPKPLIEAEVLITTTEEGLSTAVPRGENAGVTIVHAPIARSMEKLGVIRAGEIMFAAEKRLPKIAEGKRNKTKAIVIVQATGKKMILGAAAIPLG